mmetsp:Transcript_42053/g.84437  ORF Transcript_42053/g.84437 Transcript_42053/m.84437 type:complete len:252 (-) Transcript_42053:768-1523(-)
MLATDALVRSRAAADHVLSAIVQGRDDLLTPRVFLQMRSSLDDGVPTAAATDTHLQLNGTVWIFGGARMAIWQRMVGIIAVVVPVTAVGVGVGTAVGAAAAGSTTAASLIAGSPSLVAAATSVMGAGTAASEVVSGAGLAISNAARLAAVGMAAVTPSALLTAVGTGVAESAATGAAATLAGWFGAGAVAAVGASATIGGAALITYSLAQCILAGFRIWPFCAFHATVSLASSLALSSPSPRLSQKTRSKL